MNRESQDYAVYSIRGLPAGVWGESYLVVAGAKSPHGDFVAEYFIITKRPKEDLHRGSLRLPASTVPSELGQVDLDLVLKAARAEAELTLFDGLEARAAELGRPEVAYYPFELQPAHTGDLLGSWMRGQFNEQLKAIRDSTKCRPLGRYLELLSQVGIVKREG